MSDDTERDAWLREALRHAPDAGAVPPSALSAAILAEARAAAQSSAAATIPSHRGATPAGGLMAFWTWLARPPIAAGFASVMAATLVGLMWWDRPMDEALPPAPAPATSSMADRAATPVLVAPAPTPAPAVPAPATSLPPTASPAAAAQREAKVRADAVEPERAKDKLAEEAPPAQSALKSDAPAAFAAPPLRRSGPVAAAPSLADAKKEAPATAPATATATEGQAAAAPAAALAPAPVPTPFPTGRLGAEGSSADAASSTRSDLVSAHRQAADPRRRSLDESREKSAGSAATPAAMSPSEPFVAARREARAATAGPMPALLASIDAEPSRWTRSSSSGGATALEPEWRDWLRELEASGAGRWLSSAAGGAARPDDDAAQRDVTTVRLFRDGRPAATIRIDGPSARVESFVGAAPEQWRATLAAGAVERLRAGLARLPP